MGYPESGVEAEMIINLSGKNPGIDRLTEQGEAKQIVTKEELLEARNALRRITLCREVADYIVSLLAGTRSHSGLLLGGSPRAGLALALAAKLNAGWHGRDYAVPDDVKEMFVPVLCHRLVLKPEVYDDGADPRSIVTEILERTAVPSLPLAH
jgi:MoxR-like ATPase